jgi:D-3-phosphoglycerate dehydrogenase
MLDTVFERSDYVVVAMPAMVGWIDRAKLRRMKPSAYLINVARAEIVDEDALYDALACRTIAGAALASGIATRASRGRRLRRRGRSTNCQTC